MRLYTADAGSKSNTTVPPAQSGDSRPASESASADAKGDAHVVVANDQSFDGLVERVSGTVVVDFFANWCGPCRIINQSLINATRDLSLPLVKLDVDAAQDVAGKYQVTSLPTIAVFHNGKHVERFVGVRDENSIRKFIKEAREQGEARFPSTDDA